ncbi:hypothetical protein C0J45_16501 [Silurus meridionalis]|nr:hypothetical protein C0J45_16501 [Silurus meridionalis]
MGTERSYTLEFTEEKTESFSFPITVPPGKTVDAIVTIGRANIDLPYNGTVKITCVNGSVLQFPTSGTYKGINYTKAKMVVNESTKLLAADPKAENEQVQSAQFAEDSKQTQWIKAESGEEEIESEEGEELAMEEEEQANEEEEFKSEEEEEQANKGEEKDQEGEQDNLAPSLRTRCEQQSLTMSLSMA